VCVGVGVGVGVGVCARACARARARVCDVLARFAHVYGPLWGECVRGFLARELLVSWPL
jgi:hypothetical protein